MSTKEEENGVDMLPMPDKLTERDDSTSQEIVALINTFKDSDTSSLENEDGWKDFKAALWVSLTTGPDEESSNGSDPVSICHESSTAPASSQTNKTTSPVFESSEDANSSIGLASWGSDSDTASDLVDFSVKESYLSDLAMALNKNEIELLDDAESRITRFQFRGKEYILSNGPRANPDTLADNILIDGFDSFRTENHGHGEDAPPDLSEEIESNEGIFKVWDLGIVPHEEDEITGQLKALTENSTAPSTQGQTANSIEERLCVSMAKDDEDGVLPSSDDVSTFSEGTLDELIQGVINLSLSHA